MKPARLPHRMNRRPTRPLQPTSTAVRSSEMLRSRVRLPRLSGEPLAAGTYASNLSHVVVRCSRQRDSRADRRVTWGRRALTRRSSLSKLLGRCCVRAIRDRHWSRLCRGWLVEMAVHCRQRTEAEGEAHSEGAARRRTCQTSQVSHRHLQEMVALAPQLTFRCSRLRPSV